MEFRWDPGRTTGILLCSRLAGDIRILTISGIERVLDLGRGEGKITAAVAPLVPVRQVVGMDWSPDMIRSAPGLFSRSRQHRPGPSAPGEDENILVPRGTPSNQHSSRIPR